jgi:hypothetical protein
VPSIEIRIYVAQYLSGPHRPGYRPRWRISWYTRGSKPAAIWPSYT